MVLVIEVAREGSMMWIFGFGETPEVDIRMRVFVGLTKPNGALILAKLSQRNCRSMRGGTQAETLSM